NHAVKGAAVANADKGRHVVTTNIEHNAVIRSLRRLKPDGFTVTSLSVDDKGRVDPRDVAEAITAETVLVSVMHSNNETGTIQPIEEIAAIARERKVLMHTDAVDSVGIVPFDVKTVGADLVSFGSNTFGGPTGVGGLYIRRGAKVFPLLDGGVQENKAELPGLVDEVIINTHPVHSLPHLVSASIRYVEGESVMLMLDDEGFGVSTRSACATGSLRASHVLLSLGLSHADAQGTLLISFGVENTEGDVSRFLTALKRVVGTLREISPLYKKPASGA
nr:cysteine desulfurase [Desulfobacterales bacterium]MCU0605653.1 cysteine desulfurase [Desulfobacterales bacterium]